MRITLCGSTRFIKRFNELNAELSRNGHVVYSVAVNVHGTEPIEPKEKELLDLVHLRKIQLSECILVIGRDEETGEIYIGDSTRREIIWAAMNNIAIYYESELHLFGHVGSNVFIPQP